MDFARRLRGPEPSTFNSLPLNLAGVILALLPHDQLARCAAVCRLWRRLVAEPSLWQAADLSAAGGLPRHHATDASLQAVLARAPGRLVSLNLGGWWQESEEGLVSYFQKETVLAAVAASHATLTHLHVDWAHEGGWLCLVEVQDILRLAPGLQELRCCAGGGPAAVLELLQTAPLRLCALRLASGEEAVERFCATLAALPQHSSLARSVLHFLMPPLTEPAAMAAFSSAVTQLNPLHLTVEDCPFDATSAAAFAALFRSTSLTELRLSGNEEEEHLLPDGPAAAELGAAIAANSQLTRLSLFGTCLFARPDAVLTLLPALAALSQLTLLDLSGNQMGPETQQGAIGESLAKLVTSLPALESLHLDYCALDGDGLGPLAEALPSLTTLRELAIAGNHFSRAFERRLLLPAVQANQSLRRLVVQVDAPVAELFRAPSAALRAAALAVEARDGGDGAAVDG